MLNNIKLQLIIEELVKQNLFNKFLASIFNYREKEVDKLVVRYKFSRIFIVDIFNNKGEKSFTRYRFINDDNNYYMIEYFANNIYVNDIFIIRCYEEKYNSNNKIVLFASLYIEENIKEIENILNKLFDRDIFNIFIKNL